jgi:sugar lactone lactonase YvrE
MQLGECPLWHAQEAALYWIDIDGCAVHRFDPASGAHRDWPMPSEPGCIAINAAGGLIVALRSCLALLNTSTGKLTKVADAPYDPATTRFNDGRCDAAGRLWVGTIYEPRTHPNAALFCVERGTLRDSGKRATVSNGLAFSPDNKTLYHADTTSHRITAYDFDVATGSIAGSRLLKQFSTDKSNNYGGRPDGAAVDGEGAYWCAMYEGGRILRLSPSGDVLREYRLPVRCPTMIAFGGDDLRTLYITTASKNRPAAELEQYPLSGCVLSLRVDVAGRLEHSYLV